MRHTLTVLLALLVVACGDRSGRTATFQLDTTPSGVIVTTSTGPLEPGQWQLRHLLDVQPASGTPGELLFPLDVALADDGSLFVAEGDPPTVKRFSSDGEFLGTIGSAGDGPGEFRSPFVGLAAGRLIVHDLGAQRATTFDLATGQAVLMRPTICCSKSPIATDTFGNVYVTGTPARGEMEGTRIDMVRFAAEEGGADTFTVVLRAEPVVTPRWRVDVGGGGGGFLRDVPLHPITAFAVRPDGRFVTGWSGEYRFRVSSDGSDTVQFVERTWDPEPLSAQDRAAIVATMIHRDTLAHGRRGVTAAMLRGVYREDDLPRARPAWERFWTDRQGRLWVRRSTPDMATVSLDLFDAEGRWLDEASISDLDWPPSRYRPIFWGRDRMAVVAEDDQGRSLVRIYAIGN